MVVPELSLMNINHRYYSIETFFKAAGEAGYRNIELWTGSMHLYVDCHEHDSVDKIRDLAAQYGIKIVCCLNRIAETISCMRMKGNAPIMSLF